jgi:hypothetical protein
MNLTDPLQRIQKGRNVDKSSFCLKKTGQIPEICSKVKILVAKIRFFSIVNKYLPRIHASKT